MATSTVYVSQEGSKWNELQKFTSTISNTSAAEFNFDPAKLNTKKKVIDVLKQLEVMFAAMDFPA